MRYSDRTYRIGLVNQRGLVCSRIKKKTLQSSYNTPRSSIYFSFSMLLLVHLFQRSDTIILYISFRSRCDLHGHSVHDCIVCVYIFFKLYSNVSGIILKTLSRRAYFTRNTNTQSTKFYSERFFFIPNTPVRYFFLMVIWRSVSFVLAAECKIANYHGSYVERLNNSSFFFRFD